jgi:hypothetical protein
LSTYPIYLIIIPSETVPFTLAATAIAIPQGLGEIFGASVFPVIGGKIADAYGLTATMWLVVACSLGASITCLFVKETAPAIVAKREGRAR